MRQYVKPKIYSNEYRERPTKIYSINSFYNKYYTSHIIGKINTDNNLYMDNLKNILSGGRIERVKRSFISLVIGGYFCF